MKIVHALSSLGFFGVLAWAVWYGTLLGGHSLPARILGSVVDYATNNIGKLEVTAILAFTGIALAIYNLYTYGSESGRRRPPRSREHSLKD